MTKTEKTEKRAAMRNWTAFVKSLKLDLMKPSERIGVIHAIGSVRATLTPAA